MRNPFEPLKVLSEDEVARIHDSALSILENDGMRVLLPEARARYAAAGAMVDEASETVRLDRSLIAAALSSAPASIEMTAPNPARNVVLGGRNVAVVPVSGRRTPAISIGGGARARFGTCTSYEKFIIDVEMLQMFAEIFQPLVTNAAEIGLDAISEVAPGGHFFSSAHTLQRYKTASYAPLVSDWRNYGQWHEDGARTVTQRANSVWHETLDRFTAPPRDPAVIEALTSFVERRRAEGGAAPVS